MELKAWWTVPENFTFPLEFYIEEDQETLIFGHVDADLPRIEAHSETFIQLETGFTATGLTRVLVVGPVESRQWLFRMIWSLGSWDPQSRARGLEMLRLVRSQPLTTHDLAASPSIEPDPAGLFLSHRRGSTVCLRPSQACPYRMFGSRRL